MLDKRHGDLPRTGRAGGALKGLGGAGRNGGAPTAITDAYTGSAAGGCSLLISGTRGGNLTVGAAGDNLVSGTTRRT